VHCCIPLWAEFAMLVFLMYVSLTFEDECSQGGDIETTPKCPKLCFGNTYNCNFYISQNPCMILEIRLHILIQGVKLSGKWV